MTYWPGCTTRANPPERPGVRFSCSPRMWERFARPQLGFGDRTGVLVLHVELDLARRHLGRLGRATLRGEGDVHRGCLGVGPGRAARTRPARPAGRPRPRRPTNGPNGSVRRGPRSSVGRASRGRGHGSSGWVGATVGRSLWCWFGLWFSVMGRDRGVGARGRRRGCRGDRRMAAWGPEHEEQHRDQVGQLGDQTSVHDRVGLDAEAPR